MGNSIALAARRDTHKADIQSTEPTRPVAVPGRWRGFIARAGICLWFCLAGLHAATLPEGFSERLVAAGISEATSMAFTPDGRLLVCEQGGTVRVITSSGLLAEPFVTVPTYNFAERGLIGIAIDPGFSTNHYVYLHYAAIAESVRNRVSRFTANGDAAVPGSELPILELEEVAGLNHNGGAIHFGEDGKLYVAVGESGAAEQAQNMSTRLGKLLRINSDGSIPADNPFYGSVSGVNRSIWALGLRNPYTFAVQPGTGRLFINDVGAGIWEEINDGVAGANYGWPNCEGACAVPSYRDPIFQYGHGAHPTNGCAITGGAFYNPASIRFPSEYLGDYFFSDLCGGWIRRLDLDKGNAVSDFASGIANPVDLRVGNDGRLYYLARGAGQVWAIEYTNAGPALTISRRENDLLVRWPAPSTGYILEAASTLPTAAGFGWQAVTNPISTSADENQVTIPILGETRFFRLSRP